MPELTVAELFRTAHVTRWQIVRTLRAQTLAEHHYLVAMLTIQICEDLEVDQETWATCVMWALHHDIPEVITGDVATPVKEKIQVDISAGISDTYDSLAAKVKDQPEWFIVKIADTIEAIRFLHTEGVGEHANNVKHELVRKLERLISRANQKHGGYWWDRCANYITDIAGSVYQ